MSEYTCSMCKGTFKKGWTDEEALNEKNELFGDTSVSECELVCDDCFQKIKPTSYENFRAKVRKEAADIYRRIDNHAVRRLLWKRDRELTRRMENFILYGDANANEKRNER